MSVSSAELERRSAERYEMPDRPVVAVLMCVHAGADAAHFAEAVASMKAQTHRDTRLHVYCDGPLTPDHESVLASLSLGDGRDRLLRGDRAIGLPSGLNALIDDAMTLPEIDLIARMDADDISLPERLEKQVAYFRAHRNVAIAGTWCVEFSRPGVAAFQKRMPVGHEELTEFMLFRSPFNHPSVMFRRQVFEQGFRYEPTLRLMQDYDLWSRLVRAGLAIGNVPEALLWFRIEKDFYARRSGLDRAGREIAMRMQYARAMGKLRLSNYPRYAGLFMVRMAPVWLKKISYKYLRTV